MSCPLMLVTGASFNRETNQEYNATLCTTWVIERGWWHGVLRRTREELFPGLGLMSDACPGRAWRKHPCAVGSQHEAPSFWHSGSRAWESGPLHLRRKSPVLQEMCNITGQPSCPSIVKKRWGHHFSPNTMVVTETALAASEALQTQTVFPKRPTETPDPLTCMHQRSDPGIWRPRPSLPSQKAVDVFQGPGSGFETPVAMKS